jgi:hypothetical protein
MRSGHRFAGLVVAVSLMASPALARRTDVPLQVFFPGVNGAGNIAVNGGASLVVIAKINVKKGSGALRASANVQNYSGRDVKFRNLSGIHFNLPTIAKCQYQVSKVGAANLNAKI